MNPLTDVLPPHVRKYVYALLAIAALAIGAYQASGGDWLAFAALLLGSLGFSTAASNTNTED